MEGGRIKKRKQRKITVEEGRIEELEKGRERERDGGKRG